MIKDREDFLIEYEVLISKYRKYVGACICGCCNSPWIRDVLNDDHVKEIVQHLRKPKSKNMHDGG